MPARPSLKGSRVLITGAARGMGALMAQGAIERGASALVLWDSDKAALGQFVEQLPASQTRLMSAAVDVSSATAVSRSAQKVLDAIGGVDIVINSAGVISGKHLLDLSAADIERTFGVNTLALYWTTQAFLPGMVERNVGRIVTIASAAGLAGPSQQTDYAASKHAAVGFTESLRAELRQQRSAVSTLTVAPFYVSTGMFEGVQSSSPLLPILNPERTVHAILAAIESPRRELLIPWTVHLVRWLRLLPPRAFDWVADWFGINKSMQHFVGRTKK
jgi:all-trans-retinol dehydrogenase (NAD+)